MPAIVTSETKVISPLVKIYSFASNLTIFVPKRCPATQPPKALWVLTDSIASLSEQVARFSPNSSLVVFTLSVTAPKAGAMPNIEQITNKKRDFIVIILNGCVATRLISHLISIKKEYLLNRYLMFWTLKRQVVQKRL